MLVGVRAHRYGAGLTRGEVRHHLRESDARRVEQQHEEGHHPDQGRHDLPDRQYQGAQLGHHAQHPQQPQDAQQPQLPEDAQEAEAGVLGELASWLLVTRNTS